MGESIREVSPRLERRRLVDCTEMRKPFDALVSTANNKNGWVNWSGLATQLASIDKTFAEKMNRFFRDRLGLVLHGADHPSG